MSRCKKLRTVSEAQIADSGFCYSLSRSWSRTAPTSGMHATESPSKTAITFISARSYHVILSGTPYPTCLKPALPRPPEIPILTDIYTPAAIKSSTNAAVLAKPTTMPANDLLRKRRTSTMLPNTASSSASPTATSYARS